MKTYGVNMSTQITSIRDLAAAVRGRRLDLGLSQTELAARARVSRQWVSEFERGKPTSELGLVIRLLEALGLRLNIEEGESGRRERSRDRTIDLDAVLDEYDER